MRCVGCDCLCLCVRGTVLEEGLGFAAERAVTAVAAALDGADEGNFHHCGKSYLAVLV